MAAFDDRRDAFENKFAHDEALRFKAEARRNKLLGLWVAEQLGKEGAEAESYAASVVVADFKEPGDADVLRKVRTDLAASGKPAEEAEIRRKLDEFLAKAIADLEAGH